MCLILVSSILQFLLIISISLIFATTTILQAVCAYVTFAKTSSRVFFGFQQTIQFSQDYKTPQNVYNKIKQIGSIKIEQINIFGSMNVTRNMHKNISF